MIKVGDVYRYIDFPFELKILEIKEIGGCKYVYYSMSRTDNNVKWYTGASRDTLETVDDVIKHNCYLLQEEDEEVI
jgi:hypothetical protein